MPYFAELILFLRMTPSKVILRNWLLRIWAKFAKINSL